MTQILLVRHGETEWNVESRIQGQTNSSLSTRGRHQAEAIALRLADTPIHAVYSSDLTRALDTATPIAARHGVAIQPAPALRERSFGAWEGLTTDDIALRFPAEYRQWRSGQGDVEQDIHASVGGETWAQVQARVFSFMDTVLRDWHGQTVLLVGHGGSLRVAVLHALGAPLPVALRLQFDNASLTVLSYRDDYPPRVKLLNDTSHWEKC